LYFDSFILSSFEVYDLGEEHLEKWFYRTILLKQKIPREVIHEKNIPGIMLVFL